MNFNIGAFFLITSFFFSVLGMLVSIDMPFTSKFNIKARLMAGSRALKISYLFIALSFLSLASAFLSHDYRNLFVWQNSNNEMEPWYLVSAIWGGMNGSMLLWLLIMGTFTVLSLSTLDKAVKEDDSTSFFCLKTILYLSIPNLFFQFLTFFYTNPFVQIPTDQILENGRGLNPLLQNPSMVIHPPCLYAGFTGWIVGASMAMAALHGKFLGGTWLRYANFWILLGWTFLTVGIILGGHWAYIELGWGGFWAWDPVENASFIPWLTGTALLHSIIAERTRSSLSLWNYSLAVITFLLSILGTFLTRSGLVQSVHAFAKSEIGNFFLYFIAIYLLAFIYLLFSRKKLINVKDQSFELWSREFSFLLNNLLFVTIAFAVLWGVFYPIFSEYYYGIKGVVGPQFFNGITSPFFLMLLVLMIVGPIISWKSDEPKLLLKKISIYVVAGIVLTGALTIYTPQKIYANFGIGLAFSVLILTGNIIRSFKKRSGSASLDKLTRLGGMIVHFGVAIMTIAIIASVAYKKERDVVLTKNSNYSFGGFKFNLADIRFNDLSNYEQYIASLAIQKDGSDKQTILYPELRFYKTSGETTAEVKIDTGFMRDIYIAFSGIPKEVDLNKEIKGNFKIYINPLQIWLWFGSVIVLFGSILSLVNVYKRDLSNKNLKE